MAAGPARGGELQWRSYQQPLDQHHEPLHFPPWGGSRMSRKVFIKTFGCQMNEYDSDKMADVLGEAQGYEKTDDPEQADLIVFQHLLGA
jgi:hypothetical protein